MPGCLMPGRLSLKAMHSSKPPGTFDRQPTCEQEQWMKGIKWFRFNDALDAIEYEDIEKLMLLAKNKIRQGL